MPAYSPRVGIAHPKNPRLLDDRLQKTLDFWSFSSKNPETFGGKPLEWGLRSLGEADLLNLLARIADGISSPLNASAIGREIGLGSHHAVNDRINDLAYAFQTWRCHRSDAHGRPSTSAQRKVYFVDPLIARLASRRHPAYRPPDVTKLSEQQIGLALARAAAGARADRFVAGEAVMYERTGTGREIDFVGARQVPIESKYVERNWKSDARTVAAAHGRGILATRNVLDTENAVWAVPACILAWLLGT